MYPPSPSTPSSHRTSRRPAAAPSTPGAPYMGTHPLPPTPYTPNHPLPGGHHVGFVPPTPYLPHANLPPVTPPMYINYGLATPPPTPARQPRIASLGLNGALAVGAYRPWDLKSPIPSGLQLDVYATTPVTTHIIVHHPFFEIHFDARNPGGVTVRDVLSALYNALYRTMSNGGTVLSTLGHHTYFAGLEAGSAPNNFTLKLSQRP